MVNPVPGYGVTTPYNKRGPYWSCNRDGNGNGTHTGVDYAAPTGAPVVAARPGTAVYSNHGAAFGYHQLDIKCGDGTRDFYAHMTTRTVGNGAHVEAGQTVGKVGAEGNVTGAHLHFERHATETGGWSCSVCRDPAPSINYGPPATPDRTPPIEEYEMPKFSRTRINKPVNIPAGTWVTLEWDVVSSGDAGTPGEAAIMIGPSAFTGTLLAQLTVTAGEIRTRMIEREKNSAGAWETTDTYQAIEHTRTSGGTYISDTRTQNVPKGARLVCQLNLSQGGTVEAAEFDCLYF